MALAPGPAVVLVEDAQVVSVEELGVERRAAGRLAAQVGDAAGHAGKASLDVTRGCHLVLQAEVGEVVAPGVEEGIGIGHGRTSLLVTLGPQAEGPEQATERSPWMLGRSEEHTSELQSLMRNSYDVFCLKKKQKT